MLCRPQMVQPWPCLLSDDTESGDCIGNVSYDLTNFQRLADTAYSLLSFSIVYLTLAKLFSFQKIMEPRQKAHTP